MATPQLATSIIEGKVTNPDCLPIVFLGALGTERMMWRAQQHLDKRSHTMCFVDHLGHGESPVPEGPYTIEMMAEAVVEVCRVNNWEHIHLVGLSIGGAVAQQIAKDYPDLVRTLTLVSTATKFGTEEAWRDKAALVREKTTAVIAADSGKRWFTRDYGFCSGNVEFFTKVVSACPDEGYAASCEALAVFDSSDWIGSLKVPTLIIAGDEDAGTTPDHLREIHEAIEGSEMHVLSPAAHLVPLEKATDFNELLTRHILAFEAGENSREYVSGLGN